MSETLKGNGSEIPEYRGFFPQLNADEMQEIYDISPLGDVIGPDVENLSTVFTPIKTPDQLLIEQRDIMDSQSVNAILEKIKSETGFVPAHGRWGYIKEMAKFAITRDGRHKSYADTLRSAEEKSGKTEAATFGISNFNGENAVLLASHFDFIGGSVGVVAGEKMLAAALLAKKERLPLVVVPTSGGMRQQENIFALSQMHRGVASLNWLRNESDLPIIFALLGPVFGGTSASIVPLGDVIIGVKGGNFGFAGSKVIGAYQGWMPKAGSQSVEANYLDRNVDVLVEPGELVAYISQFIKISKPREKINKEDQISHKVQQELWDLRHLKGNRRSLVIPKVGFAPALFYNQAKEENVSEIIEFPDMKPVNPDSTEPDDLFENYLRIISDEGRPDNEFLIRQIFDDVVPLYNRAVVGNKILYPPIISLFARIGNQPFFVASNQPSFEVRRYKREGRSDDVSIKKISATPRPVDFDRFSELMSISSDRGIPAITFTDTLGAEPTIDAERRGQSKRIALAIRALIRHKKPVISVITGGLGSGGGAALSTFVPKLLALDYAQLWVAEAKSAASILHGTDKPSEEQVKELLGVFECTPLELKNLGFPIDIIRTNPDPYITARNIREKILETYVHQAQFSEERLLKERQKALAKLGTRALRLSQ